jgi:hypothetical protein
MKNRTYKLQSRLQKTPSLQARLKLLKDAYKGEECYIVCCGPSLADLDLEQLQHKLSDKFVIAVKQAYDVIPGQTDLHVFNYVHYKDFIYKEPKPIVVELTRFGKILSKDPELPIPINVREAGSYPHSVASRKNFDKFTLDKQIQRPFGPGLMYELGFYLAVHVGSSGITTIGFDCTAPTKHFYGDKKVDESKMKILKKEMRVVVTGMYHFARWLDNKKAPLKILSPINPAPPMIPRISIDDIPEPL